MNIIAICGILVIAVYLVVVLRQHRPEMALALTVLVGVGVMTVVLFQVLPVLDTLRQMMDQTGLAGEYGTILLKALGICLLTQITADACKDAGEAGLAAKAELAGKVMLLILSLPLFQKVGEMAVSLMNGA